MLKPLTPSLLIAPLLLGCATHAADDQRKNPPVKVEQVPMEQAGGFECAPKPVQYAVGKIATQELATELMQKSGAMKFRWIAPNMAVTADYRFDRINVSYDSKMVITRISCG
ncbi:MAG: I78 family peptidase inhibitor [Sphingorhabdus sp.]